MMYLAEFARFQRAIFHASLSKPSSSHLCIEGVAYGGWLQHSEAVNDEIGLPVQHAHAFPVCTDTRDSAWKATTVQRRITLPASRGHSTELATAAQSSQAPAFRRTVEKAYWRIGTYTTATCSRSESRTVPQSHLFGDSPTNALRSSKRALKTVKSEN